MEYRILGKTDLRISRMGFGGIPIQKTSAEETKILIRFLMEQGVNYIDTARGYTVSEEYLGYALEGIRDRFVIATKSMARTKEAMEKDIAVSMKNLRTDYIDLYQVHNPTARDLEQVLAPGGALEALQEAKTAGRIGHIGITLHAVELFQKAVEMDWVETIMFPYNIVETQGEALIAKCKEKNIGFIDMKPLAGGAIEDAKTAIRFIVNNPNVTVVIPGMATVEEAKENLTSAMDNSPLTQQEMQTVEAIRKALGSNFCRRCNYCAPCAAGISIPAVFMMEGYYNRYDLKDWAKARYDAFDHKASECIGCGVCETRCPYNLPIRQMMKKAAETFGI
ncbi:MAG: aldo/keto reductase [Oscillospiraceae bacterium]|nr:aldo/keto reductase [Oscillospiraceae bacterium]